MTLVIAGGVFTLVFVMALAGLAGRSRKSEQKQTLARRLGRPGAQAPIEITRRERRRDEGALVSLYRLNLLRQLEQTLWQAGLYLRVSEMLLIIVLTFAAGLLIVQTFGHYLPFALAAAAGCALAPIIYVRWRRRRRLDRFVQQLPGALDLIKSALEAGHSLNRGLQVLVNEFDDPLRMEFRTALEQSRIGLPLARALQDLLQRVPVEDLRLLVVAVKIQHESGSSLAPIIGRLAAIVRLRQRLRLQIRAVTAQARMGGYIVGALPVIVLGIFTLLQPSYSMPLFTDPARIKILRLAIILDSLGFLTIRRLLKIKY